MIGHDAVGDDSHPVKGLQFPHQGHKMLPFLLIQNEPTVHHTGDAVVVAFPLPTDTSLSHGGRMHQDESVRENIVQ